MLYKQIKSRWIGVTLSRHLLHNRSGKDLTVGVFVALDAVAAPGVPLFEEEEDGLVYQLYNLTEEYIRFVEKKL